MAYIMAYLTPLIAGGNCCQADAPLLLLILGEDCNRDRDWGQGLGRQGGDQMQLVSCLHFCGVSLRMWFWLDRTKVAELAARDWAATLIRTDTWTQFRYPRAANPAPLLSLCPCCLGEWHLHSRRALPTLECVVRTHLHTDQ